MAIAGSASGCKEVDSGSGRTFTSDRSECQGSVPHCRVCVRVQRGGQRERAYIYVKDRSDLEIIHSEEQGTYLDKRYLHHRERMIDGTEVVKDITFLAHDPMSYEDVTVRI